MFHYFRITLASIGLLGLLGMVMVISSPNTAAVDVFKHCADGGAATNYCKEVAVQDGTNPVIHAIKLVIDVISYIAGAASIIGLIVSALRMILANGDSASVASARNGILYSLIGVGVIVLAQVIVVFVLDRVK